MLGYLPAVDADRLMEILSSVHYLHELAERPLTLQTITKQLDGKHTLAPVTTLER